MATRRKSSRGRGTNGRHSGEAASSGENQDSKIADAESEDAGPDDASPRTIEDDGEADAANDADPNDENNDASSAIKAPRMAHDGLFKHLFGEPQNAASVVRSILPQGIVDLIDWDTFRLEHASTVNLNLEQRHSDLLYSAELRQQEERGDYGYDDGDSDDDIHSGDRRWA